MVPHILSSTAPFNTFFLSFIALTLGCVLCRKITPDFKHLKTVGAQLGGNKIASSNRTGGKGHLILYQEKKTFKVKWHWNKSKRTQNGSEQTESGRIFQIYNHWGIRNVELVSRRTQETDFHVKLNHFLEETARCCWLQCWTTTRMSPSVPQGQPQIPESIKAVRDHSPLSRRKWTFCSHKRRDRLASCLDEC